MAESWREIWSAEVYGPDVDMEFGDFVQARGPQIAIREGSGFRILGGDGSSVAEFSFEGESVVLGEIADLDNDGKDDLLLGGRGANGARILVVSGRGERIQETIGGLLRTGNTYPVVGPRGEAYFFARSPALEPPGLVGRIADGKDAPEWIQSVGSIPVALSVSESYVAVANRAVTWPVSGPEVELLEPGRHSLLVFDSNGRTMMDEPFGPPAETVWYDEPQYSGLSLLVVESDHPTVYVAAQRASEVYRGRTELYAYDFSGEKFAERRETIAGEATLTYGHDDSALIAVWNTTGDIVAYDEALQPVAEVRIPSGGASFQGRADILEADGDEIIVSDLNRVYLYSADLRLLFSTAVRGVVRDVATWPGSSPRIAVLADELVVFGPADDEPRGTIIAVTDPPVSRVTIDGSVIRAGEPVMLSPGTYPVWAPGLSAETTVDVHAGRLSEVRLDVDTNALGGEPSANTGERVGEKEESELPAYRLVAAEDVDPPVAFLGAFDLLADPGEELLFFNGYGRYEVRSQDLHLLASGTLGRYREVTGLLRMHVPGDVDGDGLDDILVIATAEGLIRVDAYRADGDRIAARPLLVGQGTVVDASLSSGNLFVGSLVTGWGLTPRMTLAIDIAGGEVQFVHPVAGFPSRGVSTGSEFYISAYTPANGVTVEWPDGTVDRDDRTFIHAVDSGGRMLPVAGTFPTEGSRGSLRYARLRKDGGHRIIMSHGRHETFAPGTPGLYEIIDSEQVVRFATGPEDSGVVTRANNCGERDYLVVMWRSTRVVQVYDDSLSKLFEFTHSDSYRGVMCSESGDWIVYGIADGRVRLESPSGGALQEFSEDVGAVYPVWLADSQWPALIVLGLGTVELYRVARD